MRAATLFVLGATALAASGANAQVVITQDTALAGNVTPGDEPGFPVELSLPGSYKLGSNITVDRGPDPIVTANAIQVDARNVTLDLNGFSIIGGTPPEHPNGTRGIDARRDGLTVKNGTITGFVEAGIIAFNRQHFIVDNMRFVSNGTGLVAHRSSVNIHNSVFSNNIRNGVICGACFVEGSIISINGAYGIRIVSGAVLGNTIVGNHNEGVTSFDSDPRNIVGIGNNTIINNNRGGRQVKGTVRSLSPNICAPGPTC